jgi:hypothetical protein
LPRSLKCLRAARASPSSSCRRTIGSFAALVPAAPCPALDALAADCVRAFDGFRAPLSERHKENLEKWGYPYVFDDFRFHMTLTGSIAPPGTEAVLACLRRSLGAVEGRPLAVDRVALLCQPDPFHHRVHDRRGSVGRAMLTPLSGASEPAEFGAEHIMAGADLRPRIGDHL